MHFLKLAFTIAGALALCISALPIDSTSPVPGISIPTSVFDKLGQSTADTAAAGGAYCGDLTIVEGGFIVPMYTSNLCTNADQFEHWWSVTNVACGLCMIWDARDCQGPIRWWGGPDKQSKDVKGSQSYWCL